MSSIRQFSMTALADLMIEEETEESYLEDEDHEKTNAEDFNITIDKSLASTQCSADYEVDDFEQESVHNLPTEISQSLTNHTAVDNQPESASELEAKTRLSDTEIEDDDTQNDDSSRTLCIMPEKPFFSSEVGNSQQSYESKHVKTLEQHGVRVQQDVADSGRKDCIGIPELLSHQSVCTRVIPFPTEHKFQLRVGHRNHRAFSTVSKIKAEDRKLFGLWQDENKLPGNDKNKSDESCTFSTKDIELMKEVRGILNKLEKRDAEHEKMKQMPRKAIPVAGVNLGSGSPSKDLLRSDSTSDGDTKIVNASNNSSYQQTFEEIHEDRISGKSEVFEASEFVRRKEESIKPCIANGRKNIIYNEENVSLSSAAEEVYATFLSDIIEAAKARSSAVDSSSSALLAMHRSLSQFLFDTFTRPNTVEIVRKNMVDAAIEAKNKKKMH